MNDYDIRSWLLEDNPDPVQLANKMLHIEPSIKSERDSLMNINWTTSLINETVDKKVDVYLERLEILLDQMDVCRKLCKNYEDTRDHGPNSLFDLSGKFSDYMFVPSRVLH
jgi:hypothetical protein